MLKNLTTSSSLDSKSKTRKSNIEPTPQYIYSLTIEKSKNSDSYKCSFLGEGVQLYDEFNCSIKLLGNKLEVFFIKDTTGKESEIIPYKKGQLLFSLQNSNSSTNNYLYKAAAYKIYVPQGVNKIIYFKKSDLVDSTGGDLKVKGIGLGTSYKTVIKQFGKPTREKKTKPQVGCYGDELETELIAEYPGLIIKFSGDARGKNFRVYYLKVTSDKWLAAPNVKVGMNAKTLRIKMGKAELYDEGEYQVLNYVIKGNDGSAQFYFKKDRLVKIQWMYESC